MSCDLVLSAQGAVSALCIDKINGCVVAGVQETIRSVCLLVSLPVCLSVCFCLSVFLLVSLSVFLSICLSICLSVGQYVGHWVCLAVCGCVCFVSDPPNLSAQVMRSIVSFCNIPNEKISVLNSTINTLKNDT